MKKKLLSCLLPLLMATPVVHASIDLVAIGQVDGNYHDFSVRTAAPLESGVAGNILGGVGSGLAYAGGNLFLALPDRGPNATPYNALVDNTTSFINRFQTFDLSLVANPSYNPATVGSMPFLLSSQLTATTLLSSATPLSYGMNSVNSAAPKFNTANKFYYTGRSDGFDAAAFNSTDPKNARLDPEGIRVSNDGKSVFITDEYGPYVYQFNRTSGQLIKAFKLPDYFAVKTLRAVEKDAVTPANGEIAANTIGRISNKGMEALAITPDGSTLVGMMQQNLIQDTKKYIRIITIDIATGATHEYAYLLTEGTSVSDILAINNHEFLVDERDGSGLGNGDAAVVKKLFKIDLTNATDVSGVASLSTTVLSTTTLVSKTLFLDVLAKLTAAGISATEVPAKLEGVAFGPDVKIGNKIKHTIFIANDNDFLPTAVTPTGAVANPNKFFVFTVDKTDLPTFVPQKIAPLLIDKHDRG
jgi:hypothetical protein